MALVLSFHTSHIVPPKAPARRMANKNALSTTKHTLAVLDAFVTSGRAVDIYMCCSSRPVTFFRAPLTLKQTSISRNPGNDLFREFHHSRAWLKFRPPQAIFSSSPNFAECRMSLAGWGNFCDFTRANWKCFSLAWLSLPCSSIREYFNCVLEKFTFYGATLQSERSAHRPDPLGLSC